VGDAAGDAAQMHAYLQADKGACRA
jgi:hypothetical protein